MKVVSIHQPNYLPWLGFIAKIACSDIYIVLDNVQYSKSNWHSRTRYSTSEGLKFLSLAVCSKGVVTEGTPIKDIYLANRLMPKKHFKTLQQRYCKRPGWPLIASRFEEAMCKDYEKMLDVCWATIQFTLEIFQLRPQVYFASQLPCDGNKTDLVLSLTQAVQGDHYLSGAGAKEYLIPASFEAQGVGVSFQEFTHPVWPQSTQRAFEPAAFALEWFIEEPDEAVKKFHEHLRQNPQQPPRCFQ